MTRPFRWGESGLGVPLYHWGHLWDVRGEMPTLKERGAAIARLEVDRAGGNVRDALYQMAAVCMHEDVPARLRKKVSAGLTWMVENHPAETLAFYKEMQEIRRGM